MALAWGGHPHGVPMGASNPAQMMPQGTVKYSPSKTLNLVVFRLWGTMKVVIFILQILNLLFLLPFYTCKPLYPYHESISTISRHIPPPYVPALNIPSIIGRILPNIGLHVVFLAVYIGCWVCYTLSVAALLHSEYGIGPGGRSRPSPTH